MKCITHQRLFKQTWIIALFLAMHLYLFLSFYPSTTALLNIIHACQSFYESHNSCMSALPHTDVKRTILLARQHLGCQLNIEKNISYVDIYMGKYVKQGTEDTELIFSNITGGKVHSTVWRIFTPIKPLAVFL